MNFQIIGINDISSETVERLICSTSDGTNIYIGSDTTKDSANVWKYNKIKGWSKITDNLSNETPNFKSINSIFYSLGKLHVGTSKGFTAGYGGQIWANSGTGWKPLGTPGLDPESFTIRKFVNIKNELYAAGSRHRVYKYDKQDQLFKKYYDQSDNIVSAYAFHWVDLESDGQNLYGAPLAVTKSDLVYGVTQINSDNTLTLIAEKGFEDVNNSVVSKLCYYNNYLYGATYNEVSGTQIWRRDGGTLWTKVNTDGFGDKNNYNVISMKVVDNKLVVSTQNVISPEIWVYDGSTWQKQTISSDVNYTDYLIESCDGINYLIGRHVKRLARSQSPTTLVSVNEKFNNSAYFWHDDTLGASKVGINKYRYFSPNKNFTMVSEGSMNSPLANSDITDSVVVSSAISSKLLALSSITPPSSFNFNWEDNLNFESLPGAWDTRFNFNPNETPYYSNFGSASSDFTPEVVATTTVITNTGDVFENVEIRTATYTPNYFNAIHAALIPKGPHRGKVAVFNAEAFVATCPALGSTPWSFQAWAIIDPSPSAEVRCLNFVLPLSPSGNLPIRFGERLANDPSAPLFQASTIGGTYYPAGVNVTATAWPNFFCIGHTWTPSGDLVVAGGSSWAYNVRKELQKDPRCPDLSIASLVNLAQQGELGFYRANAYVNLYLLDRGVTFGTKINYCWNPAAPGSWTSRDYSGNVYSATGLSGHYSGAGAWTRGPDLVTERWYPTAMLHPKVSRTGNNSHVLVLGGESQNLANIVDIFDNYESLIVSGPCTASDSGLGIDIASGVRLFDGPSLRQTSSLYNINQAQTPYWNSVSTTIWNDSLYFYPRTFVLSGGEVSFAGFTHRSSILTSHDSAPGVWDTSKGNDVSTVNAWDKFRFYGSAFRAPNTDGKLNKLYRVGGADIFQIPLYSETHTQYTDVIDFDSAGAKWERGPLMNTSRAVFNTVLLPDATVFATGGYEYVAPLPPGEGIFEGDNSNFAKYDIENQYKPELHPVVLLDHHTHTPDPLHEHSVADMEEKLEHLKEYYDYDFYNTSIQESNQDPNNPPVDSFLFHRFPEVFDYTTKTWTMYDWAPGRSWRDYHSTALLLPDGRIFVAGGEFRHSNRNLYLSATNGIGFDFEVFSPRYLRPSQNPSYQLQRPTNVSLVGQSINTNPEVSAYNLSYSQTYDISCSPFTGAVSAVKVVLMPPGSVTHHWCATQRYYECQSAVISANRLQFTLPANDKILLQGFYMIFMVTNERVPSEAIWARLL